MNSSTFHKETLFFVHAFFIPLLFLGMLLVFLCSLFDVLGNYLTGPMKNKKNTLTNTCSELSPNFPQIKMNSMKN